MSYLSVCAIYRNEAPYMQEWLEFHLLEGVERFYLYDNSSTDEHLEVLRPYVDEGLVVLHEWNTHPGQIESYNHCLAEHGPDTRWLGFIDLDEYLFSPAGESLSGALREFEQWPGVGHIGRSMGRRAMRRGHRVS